jgi:hypothetical protein
MLENPECYSIPTLDPSFPPPTPTLTMEEITEDIALIALEPPTPQLRKQVTTRLLYIFS